MTVYAISQLVDRQQIRAYLERGLNYAAYALGDLEPPYANHATWIAASRTGEIEGLALVYDGLEPPVLFLMGESSAVGALLLHGVGPDEVFFTAQQEHERLLHDFYAIEYLHPMYRMRVVPGTFKPLADTGQLRPQMLDACHVEDVTGLIYETAQADSRALHDVAYRPEMVPGGFFYGVYEGRRLVAVGGTHLVAPEAGVAAVGNVVVHRDYRRRGLGTVVSQAVTQALLDAGFNLVVLNVRQSNGPAIRMYQKLGYRRVGEFVEGFARRY